MIVRNLRVSTKIIDVIRNMLPDNPLIQEFLIELIYDESELKAGQRWRNTYREKLKEYTERSEIPNAHN